MSAIREKTNVIVSTAGAPIHIQAERLDGILSEEVDVTIGGVTETVDRFTLRAALDTIETSRDSVEGYDE